MWTENLIEEMVAQLRRFNVVGPITMLVTESQYSDELRDTAAGKGVTVEVWDEEEPH